MNKEENGLNLYKIAIKSGPDYFREDKGCISKKRRISDKLERDA